MDSPLLDLCTSPSHGTLATLSRSGLSLWNIENGELRQRFDLAVDEAEVMSWSPLDVISVGSRNGEILLLPIRQEEVIKRRMIPGIFSSQLDCMAWSPDGRILACGGNRLDLFDLSSDGLTVENYRGLSSSGVTSITWMPGSSTLVTCSPGDNRIHVWHTLTKDRLTEVEVEDEVSSLSFSSDGRLLAAKSRDGTVSLFRTDTWSRVATLPMKSSRSSEVEVAFSPRTHTLASMGAQGDEVQLWEVDVATLLGQQPAAKTVHSVSAKVVLVGEGRAGKSSLALRLAQDRYEELPSTHGMRVWPLPVEQLAPESPPPPNERREIILWDMGGQSEYRLVHQLFYQHTSAALMVMEPGRGKAALDEIEGWNRRLTTQAGDSLRRLLVGTKVDDEFAPQDVLAIEQFRKLASMDVYLATSAKTRHGIQELKNALVQAIDWDNLASTSRPELFQRLREHIQRLRESGRIVIPLLELEEDLRKADASAANPEALRAVVEQLARQGLVADTRLADGTRMLVLEIEQVERYANSLIVAARDNPHGVPAVEVAAFSRLPTLPRIRPEERLRRDQEVVILDCVVEMLLQHGLCLRHQGLLIFPSLFPPAESAAGRGHAVSLSYEFSGPVDNVYASLITAIATSQGFGTLRLWEDRAEFSLAGQGSVGVRRMQAPEQQARGAARLELYFDAEAPEARRALFVSYVDMHLRTQGVELLERLTITCSCGHAFPEEEVRRRLARGAQDIGCPECDKRTPLTAGAEQARERDPQLPKRLQALRIDMREHRTQSVVETKMSMMEAQIPAPETAPIRILHLSDLHISESTDPMTVLQPLVADLQRSEDLSIEGLDYLVLSGDITNRASPGEFSRAREFVSALIEAFQLTADRCVIVPGNHDLDWNTQVYEWKNRRQVDVKQLKPGSWREEGAGYLIRDDARYQERFRHFSEHFYHPLRQREYPLAAEQQCIPFLSAEFRLQFLAMNSASEIDEFHPERSSIHDGALSRGLQAAEQQLSRARANGQLARDARVLRLAVWHHPITGNEKMQQDAFLGRLQQAGVRLCLHGHVHEGRDELVNYLDPKRQVHIIGAGSFGAPARERPESVPRLYNLLEVQRDHSRVRVHTRALRRDSGAWEGWAVWPSPQRGQKRSWYELSLTK